MLREGTHMGGIYKVTMGHWDANGEAVKDDYTEEDYQEGVSVMDGDQLVACDRIDIPIIEVGDQAPPPGTMVYLLGVPTIPDGIYTITGDYNEVQEE